MRIYGISSVYQRLLFLAPVVVKKITNFRHDFVSKRVKSGEKKCPVGLGEVYDVVMESYYLSRVEPTLLSK